MVNRVSWIYFYDIKEKNLKKLVLHESVNSIEKWK